jgi:hypothetical protein
VRQGFSSAERFPHHYETVSAVAKSSAYQCDKVSAMLKAPGVSATGFQQMMKAYL